MVDVGCVVVELVLGDDLMIVEVGFLWLGWGCLFLILGFGECMVGEFVWFEYMVLFVDVVMVRLWFWV